jgi:LacI family transcriptional regulator
VTLEEIARLAGLSRSTVSRVVNNDRRVSAAARARVEELVRLHDFHPNSAARSLASRRTRILGLLIPNRIGAIFADPFFALLVQGMVEACNAADHNLMVLMDPSNDPAAADRLFRRVIRGRHLDGVVIASSEVDDPIVDRLAADGFPIVLVGRHPRLRVNVVDVDNRGAARAAVEHLLSHGRRRIALIAGRPTMIASIDRAAGWADALTAAGIAPEPTLIAHGDFSRPGGHRAMRALLDASPSPPDAVFVASDVMAGGALQALAEAGVAVPDRIAVMGFDGVAEGSATDPPLSTVAQPIADLGRGAVAVLLEAIAQPDRAPIERLFPTTFLPRRSCGCGLGRDRGPGGAVTSAHRANGVAEPEPP